MAKALLINPGFELEKHRARDNYVFPFGLAYIAAHAEKYGHQIKVWDIHGTRLDYDQVVAQIEQMDISRYDLIGITGIVNQYLYVKKLTELLKKYTKARIVLGGPLSSYSSDIILKHTMVDICVIGEGEQTFLDLLNGVPLSEINGIAFKSNDEILKTGFREQITDLDSIGYPAFHLFDMDFYITHTGMMDILRPYHKNKRIMSLITSRGCPYNCRFCSKSTEGTRMKSLDFLFKEIEYYKNELRIEAIHFVDELLLLNKKRFLEFCRRIKEYNIDWDCQGRINLVDEEILRAMKASNGICIGFGIESGSQKILDAMDKKIKREDIKKVLSYCLKIRLPVKIQLIFGYPGENSQTLNETVSLFKDVRLPGRRFGVITPLPGAPLYEEAKRDGFIGDKETDRFTEVEYLEFLSNSGGWVNTEAFYNRTEFPDDVFFFTLYTTNNLMFNQFLVTILRRPFFIIKYRSLYKLYIRNWWRYRDNLIIFSIPKFFMKVVAHPEDCLKFLKITGKIFRT
ncbi:B12-binding domain-containing radical SAM protein [Chloroflexota bacterium]